MDIVASHGLYPRGGLASVRGQALNSRRLHLILFVTEQCNYRCTYCYESFSRGRMQESVVEGVAALIRRRAPDLDFLEIGWFGGEPLAAFDIIKEISDVAIDCGANSRFAFLGNISTNAHLLDVSKLEYLLGTGTKIFQITLDGTQRFHDQARVTSAGKGTFLLIWKRLQMLKSHPGEFEIIVRVHLCPGNVEDVRELQRMLDTEFGEDGRFKFHYLFLENYGINASSSVATLSLEEQSSIISDLRKRHARTSSMLETQSNCYVCYASFANSFAIRSDGKIVKCTMSVDDERNIVGSIDGAGLISVDKSKFNRFLVGLGTLDESTLACPWSSVAGSS